MEHETKQQTSGDIDANQNSMLQDLVGGLFVLIVTLGLFVPSVDEIYIDPRDPGFSSRDFPIGVLSLLVLLSALLLLRSAYSLLKNHRHWHWQYSQQTAALFRHVLPIIGLGFCYAWLVTLFQYFIPTFLITAFSMAIYGNRGVWRLLLMPLLVTIIFYLLFFGILGLYEQPGSAWAYNNQLFFTPMRETLGNLMPW